MNGVGGSLRALGLGEIFDRAVQIVVRNPVTMVLIIAVVTLPEAVCAYVTSRAAAFWIVDEVLKRQAHPAPPPPPGAGGVLLPLEYILEFIGGPFSEVVVGVAVAAIYAGRPVRWLEAYRIALRRFGSFFVTLLASAATMAASVFCGAIVFGLAVGIGAVLMRGAPPIGIALLVVAAAIGIAWFLAEYVIGISLCVALLAVGIEGIGPADALSLGFRRIWNRGAIGRALLFALALIAYTFGVLAVDLGFYALAYSLHAAAIEAVATALIGIVSTAFMATVFTVFYFDLRVRSEGLDLERRIDGLESAAPA